MKNVSPALAVALVVGLTLLPGAAWAWGSRAAVPGPSSPVTVIVVRPSPVVVTPPVVQPSFVDRPTFDRHRVVLPKLPALEPLPQPVWVPGSLQSADAQLIRVPSHFEGPGHILILRNPATQP